jgi:SAM-dependent methyltransferase
MATSGAGEGAAATAGRFSGRVGDYERGRPGYPPALYDAIVELAALPPGGVVADIGAGTGLSSEPLLERGFSVIAVEPGDEMRAAAERRLGSRAGFSTRPGSAEATGLADGSVDLVLAAQAFHWFDPTAARVELRRVLRRGGSAAVVWNARRATGTPFLEAYEALLLEFGTDYREVGHRGVGDERLRTFFGGPFEHRRFDNHQVLDLEGLRARLLSSSYVPAAGRPRHDAMLTALARIFAAHQEGGRVELEYDVDLSCGPLV